MKQQTFQIPSSVDMLPALMGWLRGFDKACAFVNNGHNHDAYHQTELLVCAGAVTVCQPESDIFTEWNHWMQQHPGYSCGFVTYDCKNDIEALSSAHPDKVGFPLMGWMRPAIVVEQQADYITITTLSEPPEQVWAAILDSVAVADRQIPNINLCCNTTRHEYLEAIRALQEHIAAGDIYEVNYCVEWFANEVVLDPYSCFVAFNDIGKTPFASFVKWDNQYMLSQSPERFLAKRGRQLISQPIKGTVRRGTNPQEDDYLREWLQSNPKEQAENVMIVDLVRNDLAKSSVTGSIQVPELFGIYSFPTVHQMISTVTGVQREEVSLVEAIKHAFPMGSMTGAPKVKAMQLIEQYERSRRGLYSGTVGFTTPDGNFDSSVVIRSIAYNRRTGYLSYQTGGAITWDAVPEQEYEELLLKRTVLDRLFGLS